MLYKNKIIAARFLQKDAQLIKEVCRARGEDVSNFVRRAIKRELARMGYLSESEKKALGFKTAYEIHMERKEKEGKEDVLK